MYFWLHWVSVAASGLSLVVASAGYSYFWCTDFYCAGISCCRALALCAGASVVAALGFGCSVARGIFLDQGSTHVLCIRRHILSHWSTGEVLLHFSLYNLSLPDFFKKCICVSFCFNKRRTEILFGSLLHI